MAASSPASIAQLAEMLSAAHTVCFLTGAGMSTESGIPDFRGPDGTWTKFNPDDFTFQKFLTRHETRVVSWQRFLASPAHDAQPNAGHRALVALERLGKVDCLVTQNIDGLHLLAGSSPTRVIEIHGTTRWVTCLDCAKRHPAAEILGWLRDGVDVPRCDDCGGWLKSATISFGQPMPVEAMAAASAAAQRCDLFVVIGSSLVVHPAAGLPLQAIRRRVPLAIVNASETALDRYASMVINGQAGELLPALVDELKRLHPEICRNGA
ncbi:MAG: sigma factor regulator FecR [Chloroflexi bacterium]|nr:sigma factor regulator FecR [Chloroflexota bacterium]